MSEALTGRCLCGDVRFEATPPFLRCVTCHCESCRRATSSPMAAYFGVEDGQWRWSGAEPRRFNSSPSVERSFCGRCGSPLTFRSTRAGFSGVIHFYTACLEDQEALEPSSHFFHAERLSWLRLDDEMPRHEGNGV